MTVVLVLATFLIFIVIDVILARRRAPKLATAQPQQEIAVATDFVEGFRVPEQFRYHPGHTWLMRERKNVIRVGIDEFAAALLGKVNHIELPKAGHWVRQGQAAWSVQKGDDKAEMVSPIEGEVVEINQDVLQDPSLIRKDPYGKGWLMTVFAPDEDNVLRNLLPKNLVQSWMQESVSRLYGSQPELAGAVAADGGRPAEDLGAIFGAQWKDVTADFFLTKK